MIQIYSPTNTDYTHNGDQPLFPSAAPVHVILNGSWTAELTHPIDADGRWKSIVKDAVVKMPSFNRDQLFRIKSTSKSDSGVTAAMEPIFMDSMGDCFLVDIRPTSKNGQQALNDMVSPNSKYSASSDITRTATAYYEYKNLIEAIAGDDDNAFLKRWGGEILYDNFTVIINERVGGDYGVEVRYGKNIPQDGVTEEVDTSAIITRIYPKAYNGYTMTNHGHVDSPLINSYPTIKAATLTFDDVKMAADAQEDDAENGVIICNSQAELDQALTQRCQEQYDAGLDKPTVCLDISMVLLQNTEQYKDYQILETVSLGDTIHCRDSHLDITSDARVIELEYDSIQKRVSSVVIGEAQYNYFDKVTDSTNRIEQVIRPNGTLMAERVQGILNGIYTQLRLQSTAAQKVNGSAFLVEDTDPESALYGAMVWGTQGLQLSVVRTADGRSWDWTTAVTAKGIVADAIVTGILSDKEGKNYWNLDTGEFRLSAESFLVDNETVQDYVDGAIDDKIAQIRELTVQLSNDVSIVPTNEDGTGGNYSDSVTSVNVFQGTADVSDESDITVSISAGITGTWDPTTRTYKVAYLQADTGAVTFRVSYSGLQKSKTFTISKSKQENPDFVYSLEANTLVIKQNPDETYNPECVTFSAYAISETGKIPYSGRFAISETTDGISYITKYTSAEDETEHTYIPSSKNVKNIRCVLYASGGTTESLDMQGVAVIRNIDGLTQEDLFNILTNNGVVQGIYLQNGQLYINAQYIATGRLASADGSSYWDINTGEMVIGNGTGQITVTGDIEATSLSAKDSIKIYNSNKEHEIINGDYSTDGLIMTVIGCDLEKFSTSQTPIPSVVLNKSGSTGVVTINAGSIGLNGSVSTGYLATEDISAAGNVSLTGKLIASSAAITNIISAYGFDGAWIIESGNRMRVDWRQNESGVWTMYFYIDDQLVRTW